jgi:hypothetical protein
VYPPQFERTRGTGPIYSREEALSVKIIAERASRECTSNGVGLALLMRFYLGEASWWSFSKPEQAPSGRCPGRSPASSARRISCTPVPARGGDAGRGKV